MADGECQLRSSMDAELTVSPSYDLRILQQPETGAEVGWGYSTLGRLPLVPALVVRLRVFEADGKEVYAIPDPRRRDPTPS